MKGTGCKNYQQSMGRRAFLSAGVGGLSLPAILQARAMAEIVGQVPPDTAVIQYWLNGAASHFETYDPKPDAPAEVRGPFAPISTNVPGMQICETLPLQARIMDKVTVIRSMHHDNSDHQHGMWPDHRNDCHLCPLLGSGRANRRQFVVDVEQQA